MPGSPRLAAILDYLTAQSRRFDTLLERAYEDGRRHAAADLRADLPHSPHQLRDHALARLRAFYHPHLLRFTRDLMATVRAGSADPDHGRNRLALWFDTNRWRLDRALDGLLWSAAETGYAQTLAQLNVPIRWVTDPHSDTCWMCQDFESGSPYRGWADLPAVPGDGTTPCGDRCHCVLMVGNRVVYAEQADVA